MKTKTFKLMATLFVAVLTLGFASCGDDDDDNGSSWGSVPEKVLQDIVGTWELESGTSTSMGITVTLSRSDFEQMAKQMKVAIWDMTLYITSSSINGARYYVKGDKLYLEGLNAVIKDYDITILTLDSSTLTLRESFTFQGVTLSCDITYRKV